jgi:hypothetical protein
MQLELRHDGSKPATSFEEGLEETMTTNTAKKRDHRIDLLRGFALASIFVNHMPGNRFENWTSRNFGLSDAAEIFVLLAGFAAALAFFTRFDTGPRWTASYKAVRRAGTLYGAHLLATLGVVALFAAAASLLGNPDYLDQIGIGPLVTDPLPGLVGLSFGGYQLGYFNILPMYVVLLLMLPAFMWLATYSVWLALGASAALYVATHALGLIMPSYPLDGGWYFNPFAWQLLFVIGLCAGVAKLKGRELGYHPALMVLAVAYVVFGAVWAVGTLGGVIGAGVVPEAIGTLHKSNLPLTRLMHILALAYVVCYSRMWDWLSRVPSEFALTRMGRNALPVFVASSLMSMAGLIVLMETGGGWLIETLLVAAGLSLMYGLAVALEADLPKRLRAAVSARVATGSDVPPTLDLELPVERTITVRGPSPN